MQLNEGKFLQNGKCGYILKPSFMLKNSDYSSSFQCSPLEEEPVIVIVQVIFLLNCSFKFTFLNGGFFFI